MQGHLIASALRGSLNGRPVSKMCDVRATGVSPSVRKTKAECHQKTETFATSWLGLEHGVSSRSPARSHPSMCRRSSSSRAFRSWSVSSLMGSEGPSAIFLADEHIRMEPGAFIPAHLHKKAAEVLCILDGDFINENKAYGSGDFLHSKPGTVHGPHTTKRGCSLLALYTANTGEADPNDFFLAEAAKRS